MEVTQSFLDLLSQFQGVFTAPTYLTFVDLMTGWLLSPRHRYVTDMIWSADCTRKGHHSRYHRFFSAAKWSLDELFCVLTRLLVALFASTGLIELAVDDTLCRKRGLTVYGTGMHHDPLISSRAKPLTSWGHDWVVITLILRNPWWAPTKVFALPIGCRLYRNRQGVTKGKKEQDKKGNSGKAWQAKKADPNHRTRPQLAVELITLVASWFPDRQFIVCGDSAYGGQSVLSKLPPNVHLISHVHCKGAMYEPAPQLQPGQKGRPRKKGARLSGMAEWAKDKQPWTELTFAQYGLKAKLRVKTRQALYYKAGGQRLLTIVLTQDMEGKRPDQMFYCTHLDWDARQILSCYAGRWAIEVTFEDCKQVLGLEDAANRTPMAVQRTAPMALFLYSLTVAWFHQTGHRYLRFPYRPWYTKKEEPSFRDMLTTLRCQTWLDKFWTVLPKTGRAKKLLIQVADFLSLAG